MEEREEETHARLMRLMRTIVEPCIAGHEGRIVKHAGDGFLAAFDSVARAADCALQVQRDLAEHVGSEQAPPIVFR